MHNKPTQREHAAQIMLLADCSSSLAPSFEKLKNALQNAYLTLSERHRVGVGVYAENFQKLSSPNFYKKETAELLSNLKPAYKSNLRDALYCAADCFDLSDDCRKIIFIFSDGGYDGGEPFDAACELLSAGIELHAIGFTGAIDCLDENLNKLTNGAFAHSHDAASYIDTVCPRQNECANEATSTCCNREICIEAQTPCFDGFYTVNVRINGGCNCNAAALCVKLMLGNDTVSEKYIYSQQGRSFPSVVTFIVPERVLPREYDISRLHAHITGNPILC